MAPHPTPAMPLAASMYAMGATTLTVRTQNFYLRPAQVAYRPAIMDGLTLLGGWMRLVLESVGEARQLRAAMQSGQNRVWAAE